MKRTKIICTVGPATDASGMLKEMIDAGMDIARFNFSHGTHADHLERMTAVRAAAKEAGKHVAILADTKGPEMRLGVFAKGKEMLEPGKKFVLTAKEVEGTSEMASINYGGLAGLVKAGDLVLLSDGLLSLQIEEVKGEDIITKVVTGGEISSRKRVAAPGVAIDLPFLSEKDVADLLFAVKEDMDFVAASFVQRAADVLSIRKVLEEAGSKMGIIAKIENAEGVKNIEEILKVSDGIMVARGDLGVEIPPEQVPLAQKSIIRMCNAAGKPVITATQMLESMMNNPRPTRAEASDVANAILDGSDVIMLSGETASGRYPLEAVRTMAVLAESTEAALQYEELLQPKGLPGHTTTMTDAISHATVQVAHELKVAAIIASSETGYTARMISRYRPQSRVIAVTPYKASARRMQMYWGIEPLVGEAAKNTDDMVKATVGCAADNGMVKTGDVVVITAGVPVGIAGSTNLINVRIVGNILLRGMGIGSKVVKGNTTVIRSLSDCEKFTPGDILVTRSLEEGVTQCALKAKAIITEEGGLTSHAAIVGVSFGIPVVVGVENATGILEDGMDITVESARGLIYYGRHSD